jgi:CRISPR-associated protein Cas6/Cse3/CasE subtype I-E
MKILTQITVSLRGQGGRHLIHSPYRLHKMLYRNFPNDQRLLYRAEPSGDADFVNVLIQHDQTPPQMWERFGAYFLGDPKYRVLEPLEAGGRYLFRLAAAPTRSLPAEHQRGRVIDILETETQLAWLRRKFEGAADIVQAEVLFSRLRVVKKADHKYRFREVFFQGLLTCKDPESLAHLRDNGIGRHKSLGAGLLSLVQVS